MKFSLNDDDIKSFEAAFKSAEGMNKSLEDFSDRILYLDPQELEVSSENLEIYGKIGGADFEALKDSIENLGILQPIRVIRNSTGKYIVQAGHRRREAAIQSNLEKVPCVISDNDLDISDIDFSLAIINANIQRDRSDLVRSREASKVKELIKIKKQEEPERYKGRVDEIAAKLMGLSAAQFKRLVNLQDLYEPIKNLIDERVLKYSTAEVFSGLSENVQKEIYDEYLSKNPDISMKQAIKIRELFVSKEKPKAEVKTKSSRIKSLNRKFVSIDKEINKYLESFEDLGADSEEDERLLRETLSIAEKIADFIKLFEK